MEELSKINFGDPLHCFIIPGKTHFLEEDVLKMFTIQKWREKQEIEKSENEKHEFVYHNKEIIENDCKDGDE